MDNQTDEANIGGAENAELEKRGEDAKKWADLMSNSQVQNAYMAKQVADAIEENRLGAADSLSRIMSDSQTRDAYMANQSIAETSPAENAEQPKTPEQPKQPEQPQAHASFHYEEPSYGENAARRRTNEEAAAFADAPSEEISEISDGDIFDRTDGKLQNKLDKWAGKTEHLTNKLQKVEMKSQARADKNLKNFHHFTVYADENGKVKLSHDVQRKPKKQRTRGILHKLDSRISGENIGFLYVGKSQTGKGLELRSADIPEPLKKARHFAYKSVLASETVALKTGDVVKKAGSKLLNAGKNKLRNELYRAEQENAGMKAAAVTAGTVVSAAKGAKRWFVNHRDYFQQSNGLKLENKQVRLKNKMEKFEMKSSVAKEISLVEKNLAEAKSGGSELKLTRAEKKKAWRKVYDGTANDRYITKPKSKLKDGVPQDAGTSKIDKRIDKLGKKEYRKAKKVYATKLVKVVSVNEATGKKRVSYKRVADTSRKKQKRPKRPDSMPYMIVAGGAKKLGRKALSEMATDDNAGVSFLGKSLQFTASEISRSKQRLARKSKLKFERKQTKAELKMESARSEKLMLEKERKLGATEPPSKKKGANLKQARKKSARKRRNAETFKERTIQAAKKMRIRAASKAKNFIATKAKIFVIAGLAVVLIILAPSMALLLLGGGGGGMIADGTVVGFASYTNDREGLMEFGAAYNRLVWEWQSDIMSQMASNKSGDTSKWLIITEPCTGGPLASCEHITSKPYVESENNNYEVIKNLYNGESGCSISDYDITCLYAFFTVKYKDLDEWGTYELKQELQNFYSNNFELRKNEDDSICRDETVVLDNHVFVECSGTSKTNIQHTGKATPHEVDTHYEMNTYSLYPKSEDSFKNVQQYIESELKKIGEKDEDGNIKVDEDGKTEGELHYELLLESIGLLQVVDYPALDENGDPIDWSYLSNCDFSGSSGKNYGKLSRMIDQNEDKEVEEAGITFALPQDFIYEQYDSTAVDIPYGGNRLECVAGGSGVITSKTSNSVTVEYPEQKLQITYTARYMDGWGHFFTQNAVGMTTLGVGSKVSSKTHLFYSDECLNLGGGYDRPALEIKAYDTELEAYINPNLVVQSRIH